MKLSNIISAVLTVILAVGCTSNEENENAQASQSDREQVVLNAEQTKIAGIAVGPLEKRQLNSYVRANGYFDVPPQNKAEIGSFKAGYVKSTSLLVGDQVSKGQIVVVLENPEFVKTQQSYMEVKGQLEYLKTEYERKKVLEQEKITAQKNLQKARADYQSALAQLQGLKQELQLMGIDLDKLEAGRYTTTINIRAPIDGTVTKVNATMGKYVLPEEVLLELVNTEHLHVELEVFEKDITKVKKGQQIRLRVPSLTDSEYQGEVFLIGKALDPETRSVHIHGHIDEEETFVPGMYVEAVIVTESKYVPAVPEQAVFSIGDQHYLFLQMPEKGPDAIFKRVEIEPGISADGWTEIKSWEIPPENAQVVLEGTYSLLSAMGEG